MVTWLSSYLSNGTQYVPVGNDNSNTANVSSGVPQGSVLGPALFALVMGSLQQLSPDTDLYMYSDDITICVPIISNCNNLASEVDNIHSWSSSVKLTLNEKKTQRMHINCSRNSVPTTLQPNIEPQPSIKLLGVFFTNNLKWDLHVSHIQKLCHSRFYAIKILKKILGKSDLLYIYKLLIRSYIEYCAPLFVGLNKKNSSILDSIQNRCHKLTCGFNSKCNCLEDLMDQSSPPTLHQALYQCHQELFGQNPRTHTAKISSLLPPTSQQNKPENKFVCSLHNCAN